MFINTQVLHLVSFSSSDAQHECNFVLHLHHLVFSISTSTSYCVHFLRVFSFITSGYFYTEALSKHQVVYEVKSKTLLLSFDSEESFFRCCIFFSTLFIFILPFARTIHESLRYSKINKIK